MILVGKNDLGSHVVFVMWPEDISSAKDPSVNYPGTCRRVIDASCQSGGFSGLGRLDFRHNAVFQRTKQCSLMSYEKDKGSPGPTHGVNGIDMY